MKKLIIKGMCALVVATTAATALATHTDTGYIAIGRLDAASDNAGGYRVYPAAGFSLPTVCEKNDFAEAQPTGPSATERDLMNRVLMSAFMSSRLVKLRLDGCHVNDKRPLYRIVTVDLEK